MSLPVHTHIAALVLAATATAVIIDVVADIGHPSPDGPVTLSWLRPAGTTVMQALRPGPAPAVQLARQER